jgi:hypothetical protein
VRDQRANHVSDRDSPFGREEPFNK